MASSEERIVPMRLQRFLARAGVASRRGSETLMSAGRVRVNGQVVREMGSKVDPATDVVEVDGAVVRLAQGPCFLVTGILLFTTDGDVAQALLHPSKHVDKHYVALVQGAPDEADLARLGEGIMLDDGPAAPARAEVIGPDDALFRTVAPEGARGDTSVVGITLHEGRKHQVKRMMATVGHKVLLLHRDAFGPLTLRGCELGSWRMLDEDEVASLQQLTVKQRRTQ